jgi:hypothetical protein
MLIPYSQSYPLKRTFYKALYTSVNSGSLGLTSRTNYSDTVTNQFSGFKQPGYRSVIAARGNATTAASGTKVNVKSEYSTGEYSYQAPGQLVRRLVQGSIAEAIYFSNVVALSGTLPFDEIQNSALLEFLKKCKATQRQFSTGVFAGELRETLHLIKNPAAALRKLLADYVSSCRRNARRLSPREKAKLVANQWLEYSFGMLPLISDIGNATNVLRRINEDFPSKYVSAVVEREYWGFRDQLNIDLYSQYVPALLLRSAKRIGGRKIVGMVSLRQQRSGGQLSESAGLTMRDFVPTVYELIPYSFLVDYFTNIGGILEAASFNQADLLWYSSTTFSEDVETYSIQPRAPGTAFGNPVVSYNVAPSTYIRQSKSFSRSLPVLGLPSLAFKIPGNWSKFLNIGALATLRVL